MLWESGYNALCFLLLWAVQAALALGFCLWYAGTLDSAYVSGQSAFLDFYRSGFLHGLLPLADLTRWLRSFVCFMALGLTTAMFGYYQRNGCKGIAGFLVLALTMGTHATSPGEVGLDVTVIAAVLVPVAWQGFVLWDGKGGRFRDETGEE